MTVLCCWQNKQQAFQRQSTLSQATNFCSQDGSFLLLTVQTTGMPTAKHQHTYGKTPACLRQNTRMHTTNFSSRYLSPSHRLHSPSKRLAWNCRRHDKTYTQLPQSRACVIYANILVVLPGLPEAQKLNCYLDDKKSAT